MGARQSRKSMDVTTTPKKDGVPAEGGDAAAVGVGKLERIEEADVKPTTNGTRPHTETADDKDIKDKDSTTEKEKGKDSEKKENEEAKVEETKPETPAETPAETAETTTPTEGTPASPTSATSPDTKEPKKKEKVKTKKKWSIRSISFSKKDKNKPVREEAPKNGDVAKEEALAEDGEEIEKATSPAEDKSAVASSTEAEAAAPVAETKEVEKPATSVEKNEAPSSPTAPTPVPVEAPKEENDKPEKKIEVSRVEAEIVEPAVQVPSKPIITTSIIERKTSEDFPSQCPSSPPPTPIDPSPLQQAQQVAANASAIAEALKLPAETIKSSKDNNEIINNTTEIEKDIIINVKDEIPVIENEQVIIIEDKKQDLVVHSEEGPVLVSLEECEKIPVKIQEDVNIIESPIVEVEEIVESSKIEETTTTTTSTTIIPVENVTIEVIEEAEIIDDIVSTPSNDISSPIPTEEIPPPLPESPIPLPKASADLLNFMSTQIADVPVLNEVVETLVTSDVEDSSLDMMIPPPAEVTEEIIDQQEDIEDLPPPPEAEAEEEEQQQQQQQILNHQTDSILTPPRSPSPIEMPPPAVESSLPVQNGEKNHKNSQENNFQEIKFNERNGGDLTNGDECPLTILKNDQSIAEPEAPVEKIKEVITKEKIEEAPKNPPPSVPVEAPVTIAPAAPAITEDVASVTKAIEEIDINEKAMAMAVNENIEAVNANEIIADMNHHNNMKE